MSTDASPAPPLDLNDVWDDEDAHATRLIEEGIETPLTLNATHGNLEIMRNLVFSGEDVNGINAAGNTPLLCAIKSEEMLPEEKMAAIRLLIENPDVDINARDEHGSTALIIAAYQSEWDILWMILDHSYGIVDTRVQDDEGHTALMLAARAGSVRSVHGITRYAEENGQFTPGDDYMNVQDNEGYTALMWAADADEAKVADELLEWGADPSVTRDNGENALMIAVKSKRGSVAVLPRLLERTDVGAVNNNQRTAFMIAAERDASGASLAALALDPRVDANTKTGAGNTALALAVRNNRVENVRKLLQVERVNVNVKNSSGCTPLMIAVSRGHVNITRLLLERRVNVNAVNRSGKTALLIAADRGYTHIVNHLLQYRDLQVNFTSVAGETALILAAEKGHAEIVRLLLNCPRTNPGLVSVVEGVSGEPAVEKSALVAARTAGHNDIADAIEEAIARATD